MSITSQADWWRETEENWAALTRIVFSQLNPWAAAHATPLREDTPPTERTVAQEMRHLLRQRDPRLHCYLNAALMLSRQSGQAESEQSLARLCQSGWVLEEEGMAVYDR